MEALTSVASSAKVSYFFELFHVSECGPSLSIWAGDISLFVVKTKQNKTKPELAGSDCIPTMVQTLSRAGGLALGSNSILSMLL